MTDSRLLPALGDLEISSAQAATARLHALRGDEVAVRRESVRQRVRDHARQNPDRIALSGSGALTYAELDFAVDRATDRLDALGVGSGDIVAVLARRSALVPVLFLALESVGAIYLPLDASWPVARRRIVLEESKPKVVLTDGDYDDEDRTWVVCDMASLAAWAAAAPVREPGQACRDDEEARYVLYTSGSTGLPKGAIVEQQGMLNHLEAKLADFGMTSRDVVAFTAPLGFDISIWQMLAPLASGGTVAVLDEETMRFPRRFIQAIALHGVSIAEVVPTFIEWLVTEIERGRPLAPGVRMLIATGEELHASLLARAQRALPDVCLVNAYGPTECSDDVTHWVLQPEDALAPRVPIGRPIDNCVLYRLVQMASGGWRAAEEGEPAELFVGGTPVGRGYLDRPDATSAAFFRDALDVESVTERLYRTGDMVSERDGVLTYLGRNDRQVKVNGTRIELGEVEAIVVGTPGVRGCAAWYDPEGEVLRVWVVCPKDVEADVDQRLRAVVPPTLRPRVSRVDALRHTHNGKVDHRAMVEDTLRPAATEEQ